MNTLVVDLGTDRTAAVLVAANGAWIVPDRASGERFWASCAYWDGQRLLVGAAAARRGTTDTVGYATGIKRGLALDLPLLMGSHRFRPSELVTEVLAAIREHA